MFKQSIYLVKPIVIKNFIEDVGGIKYIKEYLKQEKVVCKEKNGKKVYYNALTKKEYKVLSEDTNIIDIRVGDIVIREEDLIPYTDEHININSVNINNNEISKSLVLSARRKG